MATRTWNEPDKSDIMVEQVNDPAPRQLEPAVTAVSDDEVAREAIGTDNLPPGYFRSAKFLGTLMAVSLMNISLYTGYVLPINVLSIINLDIGPSPNVILVPIVKTLAQGAVILLVGRLGDIFGRRWFLIAGQTCGVIGAAVGATATNMNVLMGCTAFVGIAGAVQLTYNFTLQELVPNKYRANFMALQFIISFPFACFGPVMARSLVLHTTLGWRWAYYINLMTCGISVVLFYFFYHPPTYRMLHRGKSMRQELWRLDYVGLVMYCGGLIMLLLGISWGGSLYPWSSARVVGLLVAGLLTIVLFFVYEAFLPFKNVHPLVPMKILRRKDFLALMSASAVATMTYNSMNVLWPQMVQALFTTDILKVGWYSAALGGGVATGQIISGLTVRAFGRPLKAHWQMRVATAAMTAFVAALAVVTHDKGKLAIALMALASFSLGFVELLSALLVPFTCAPGDIGLASGFQISVRNTMGTIATGVYATVLSNRNLINIPKVVGPAAVAAGLSANETAAVVAAAKLGTPAAYAAVPGMTPAIKAAAVLGLKVANAMSFRTMFLISLAFGLFSTIASVFIGNLDAHFTNEVARKLQDRRPAPEVMEKSVV